MRATRLMFLSAGTALLLGLGAPTSAGTHAKMMGSGTMGGMLSGEKKAGRGMLLCVFARGKPSVFGRRSPGVDESIEAC